MSKKKGLDFVAGRLGSIPKQDDSPREESPSRGGHYNSGRLGIMSPAEADQADQEHWPAAQADQAATDAQPATDQPDVTAEVNKQQAAEPVETPRESQAAEAIVEEVAAADAGAEKIAANTEPSALADTELSAAEDTADPRCEAAETASSDNDCERVIFNVEQKHDVADFESHEESPPPPAREESDVDDAAASVSDSTSTRSFRLGSSADSGEGQTVKDSTNPFNVEIFSSGKRKNWLPAAAAVLVTVGAVAWVVWQRTENRLQTLQAAATTAAPLSSDIPKDSEPPEADVRQAASQDSTAGADQETLATDFTVPTWMAGLANSFSAWTGEKTANPDATGDTTPAVTTKADHQQPDGTVTDTQPDKPVIRYRDCPAGISLSSIMLTNKKPMACINGYFVTKGSVIQGARVVDIQADSVVMEINGERFDVLLGQ